ncbi:MAG: AMP-binding protein [Rudanella sp.]|nr:AMP-binding protein [Rudanella sp.]
MFFLDGRLTANQWPAARTPYEEQAVLFGRAWQSGQTEFVLHTSGSTGTPKPIRLTRAQMQASAELTGQTFGLRVGDTALCCLNIAYVAGTMMLVRALTLGLQLTIVEPSGNPLAGFDTNAAPFDLLAFVPLQLQTILEQTPAQKLLLNRAKAILLGGAAISPAQETQLQPMVAPVYATYGMTETVSHIAIRRLNGSEATNFFTALSGVALDVDERNCLTIRAAASGFQLIQTNDVVEWVDHEEPHTQFRIMGRADSIINTGGVKVQPERIERLIMSVLTSVGLSPRLFVAGRPNERLGQQLVLVVEGDWAVQQAVEVAQEQWSAAIRQEIGPYAVPKALIFAPSFRETPTGKIDRKATMEMVYSL